MRADSLLLTYTEIRNTPEADVFDQALRLIERIAYATRTDPAKVALRVGRVLNRLDVAGQLAALDRLRRGVA